jgi:uncharacterized protein YggE
MELGRRRVALVAGLTLAGLALGLWAGIGRPEAAQGQTSGAEPARGITVSGTGSVKAAPDRADFSFGVETQGDTAEAALAANSVAVRKVIDALEAAGVASSDIQTQQVSVSPRYDTNGQKITGYSAVNSVNATLRDLAEAGAVVDAAVRAGANQVYGPTLSISDQSGLYADALEKALEDARSKAKAIAAAAGVSLGSVVNIVEGEQSAPPIPLAATGGEADQSAPIEPGLQDIQATLRVTFAIA